MKELGLVLGSPLISSVVANGTTVQSPTAAHIVCKHSPKWWILRSSLPTALLGFLIATVATTTGCAGADGQEASAREDTAVRTNVKLGSETSIFGGAEDDDHDSIPGVVALKVLNGNGTFELCSGALVSPNVVLTARHCVTKSITTSVACDENGKSTNGPHVSGDHDPADVSIYIGASPKFGAAADAVAKVIVAPKSDYLCDNDIALLVIDKKITDVEPIAVRLGASVARGENVRSVGYGQNDKKVPIGTRFRKPNVAILAMGKGVSESKTALGAHEFEVGKSICQGDSGGPAISEDTGAVVGVVSRGGECDEDYGHIYTTTSGWTALFDEAFKLAGGAPIVESGQPIGTETGPRATAPIKSPLVDQPKQSQSCSTSMASTSSSRLHNGAYSASLALVVACAMVLRRRRVWAHEK